MFKLDDFDSATIASVILGIGDITWLTHDIMRNGFSWMYFIIGMLFLIGNIGLAIGLYQHNTVITPIKRKSAKAEYIEILKNNVGDEL